MIVHFLLHLFYQNLLDLSKQDKFSSKANIQFKGDNNYLILSHVLILKAIKIFTILLQYLKIILILKNLTF